jgi:multidrug efflux pump subunit AcrA (membrane-fusion protein)
MERLLVVLTAALILAVTGLGIVTYRAAEQAHDDQAELACLQRAQATATIALLATAASVDADGRLQAMNTLGAQVDGCGS